MRAAIAGFFLGAVLLLLALVVLQRRLVTPIVDDLSYHFYTCVFGGTEFPDGDVDNGRLLRRMLLPIRVTTTFYNGAYQEVKQADRPGRYGAVVRIETLPGVVVHRFITLYRTPQPIAWDTVPVPVSAQLPAELGLDPVVLRNQQREIGRVLANPFNNEEGSIPTEIAVLLAGLSETAPTDPPAFEHDDAAARDAEWWYGLRLRLGLTPRYSYLADLPHDYDADAGKRWPLILFLDHADDAGNDLQRVRTSALPGLIHHGKQLPAIVVTPQCPGNESWSIPVLSHLLDTLETKYRIDPDRIYLTGVSAGGDETWDLALAQPERFAAIVPMSGESDPDDAARLVHLPVWAFHGMKDDVVPVIQTVRMVEAIRRAGGSAHMTLYPDAGHASTWDRAYTTDALYTWLFAQRRAQLEVRTPGLPSP
jgi:hypothetical protein